MAFHISSLKVEGTQSKTQRGHLTVLSSRHPTSVLILIPHITVLLVSASYLHLHNNERASGTGEYTQIIGWSWTRNKEPVLFFSYLSNIFTNFWTINWDVINAKGFDNAGNMSWYLGSPEVGLCSCMAKQSNSVQNPRVLPVSEWHL